MTGKHTFEATVSRTVGFVIVTLFFSVARLFDLDYVWS